MSAGDRGLAPPLVERHIRKPFTLEEIASLVSACCTGGGKRLAAG
ncbi:MAG: hypothetical protein QM767_26800 [Anaeromyxobacter sp.]